MIHIKIEGISSYLMHRFSEVDEKARPKTGKKDYKSEAERALYKTEEGKYYIPSSQIHGCIINAGKYLQIVGRGKATYAKLFGAFILITPAALLIDPQIYVIDERPVVIQKSRIIRYRPKWDKWSLEFNIEIMDPSIAPEVVSRALEQGGRYVGIGDFRPEKRGPFGRFIQTKFEIK